MSYSIGVDIGGTNIAIGIVRVENAEIIAKTSFKTRAPRPVEEISAEIADACKKLCKNNSIDYGEIDKIGVATPGVVKDNVVTVAYNLGWENAALGEIIGTLTGKPCFVANDANVAAYAEAIKGEGRGAKLVAGVTIGTGIGGGIIIDGKIHEGKNGFAAEAGHIIIEEGGRECACGKRGCLEAYCSASALVRDTRLAMRENRDSLMWKITDGDESRVSGRTAFEAARAGDRAAAGVVDAFINYLAIGVSNIINLLQPDTVCIGGGVSGEGDALLVPLNKRVKELSFGTESSRSAVVCASFRNDAGIIGAALLGESREESLYDVLSNFIKNPELIYAEPYGNGHINDTYKVSVNEDGKEKLYILQRMNKNVFKTPWTLMENMIGVTDFLRNKVEKQGGDTSREVMSVYRTLEGCPWYCDKAGEYWRLVTFITNSKSYDKVERPEQFYASAVAFGNFQRLLSDYPASSLSETIPNFHNTPVRYQSFLAALADDPKGRANGIPTEIEFVKAHEEFAKTLEVARESGRLPLRVTHNDTKLNNILFDIETDEPICVVDLDTIMPGYSVNDFGDSIRFGASTALEDEADLDKVEMSLELYELYVKGFIEGTGGALTDAELELMPYGAMMMTFECGTRFLTDYLMGDTYFKTAYPEHNLVRARNQFKLVRDMEAKFDKMKQIVNKYIQK